MHKVGFLVFFSPLDYLGESRIEISSALRKKCMSMSKLCLKNCLVLKPNSETPSSFKVNAFWNSVLRALVPHSLHLYYLLKLLRPKAIIISQVQGCKLQKNSNIEIQNQKPPLQVSLPTAPNSVTTPKLSLPPIRISLSYLHASSTLVL